MCRPGAIQRNQTTGVDCTTEDVFWKKISFIPDEDLASERVCGMLSLSDTLKPFPIRVIAVLKPLVD